MRVALIYLGRKGGGPVYALEVAKRLQAKSELLVLVSTYLENLPEWKKQIKNIVEVKTYHSKASFLLSLLDWGRWAMLRKQIKDFKPEVIYYPFFHPWLVVINHFFPKVPKVFTCHDPVLHQGERNLLIQQLQNRLLKQSRVVIILSRVFRSALVRQGIPEKNIHTVPHGIFDYYFKDKPEIKRQNDRPTLLFFGRIVEYKGLDILLKAFGMVKKQLPRARLVIAGAGDLNPYRHLINQEGVEFINRWIADSEVAPIFQEADVLVCPYRDASQSGAIPVAYAFHLPVVASDTGGLSEQVQDYHSGLVVPVGDVEALAQACLILLQQPDLRIQMGAAGYQIASTLWSWDRVSEDIAKILAEAIN